ncbi:MAG TPA: hypothetical protein VKT19_08250 [Steroidobacteraceae bacterium]|nr:hypothetical protein [Steroidobacteraceae bacterium]
MIVWIDHHKAVVWHFAFDAQSKTVVKAHNQREHTHLRKSPHGGHRAPEDLEFFAGVAAVLADAREILLIGPAQAKDEFVAFLRHKHPAVGSRVVAVETADHPTDAELLAYARRHFKALDRML